jgi:hypothetical protein
MRLPVASGDRLKRMAKRYGWTPSDTSARLVEEGLLRSEFAFIDFRDSAVGPLAEQDAMDFTALKRMLPQAVEFSARKSSKR